MSLPFNPITYKEESAAAEFIADTLIPAYSPAKAIEVQAVFDKI